MLSSSPISNPIILCIDDNEAILRYEEALLKRAGYVVFTAQSAKEGLRLATMCDCDMVLLDYDMPVMNGHEVAAALKRIRPNIPVILLSGGEVPNEAILLADAFIPKLDASQHLLPLIRGLCRTN